MSEVLFIVVLVLLAVYVDHVRFNKKLNNFLVAVNDFSTMCTEVVDLLQEGEKDVEFQGNVFYMYLNKGDFETFVRQLEFITDELMDRYDKIGARYLSEMEDSVYAEVETYKEDIQNVQNKIRIVKWKNGWK